MSQLPNHKLAPSVDPHRPGGGTVPHGQVRKAGLTAKAQDVSYVDFIAAGWTDAELRAADLLT